MKIYECEQGSAEWYAHRFGVATASEFSKIVTPTGKLSSQASDYAYRMIAEELIQRPMIDISHLPAISHGKEYEQEAASAYEFDMGEKTVKVGIIKNDAGTVAASPDRLVGASGLLEIKCPEPQTMVKYFFADGVPKDYWPQVQGQLWVAEREWCDWFAYSREMPPVRIRTNRDEAYIATLSEAVLAFADMKASLLERIKATGFFDTLIQNPQARELPTSNIFQ